MLKQLHPSVRVFIFPMGSTQGHVTSSPLLYLAHVRFWVRHLALLLGMKKQSDAAVGRAKRVNELSQDSVSLSHMLSLQNTHVPNSGFIGNFLFPKTARSGQL